jgi:membrane protease YdiL (CAAX protease family)
MKTKIKKILITAGKVLLFFVGWTLLIGPVFLLVPDTLIGAVWRFLSELIPFLFIVGFTLLFWLFEKKRIKLCIVTYPVKNILIGVLAGIIWIGAAAGILVISGTMKIVACNSVPMLWLWIISVFINAAMQELLVRGYLYQMLKTDYNVFAAAIVTTALFTLMHGGAFEAGIIPVMNVLTMSILMTVVTEYTQSLIAPVIMHFIWNCAGAVILGGVNLADDYPSLCTSEFTGNELIAGGAPKIEGSIVVLVLNILLISGFVFLSEMKKAKVSVLTAANNP